MANNLFKNHAKIINKIMGETCEYTHGSDDPVTINATITSYFQEIKNEGYQSYIVEKPVVLIAKEDISFTPLYNDILEIRGNVYQVTEVKDDQESGYMISITEVIE